MNGILNLKDRSVGLEVRLGIGGEAFSKRGGCLQGIQFTKRFEYRSKHAPAFAYLLNNRVIGPHLT